MSKRKHAIEAHFQNGLRLHRAGRLPEAEQIYRQVLGASPAHADSLHMLGVIATQCGQPQAALSCIDQAIAMKPTAALFHVNRAAALLALRQPDDALAACQQALRIKPNLAEAHQEMGHALSDLGRPDEAIAAYRLALRHQPGLRDGRNSLALALRESNRLEEAADVLEAAVQSDPEDQLLAGNLAGILKDLGRLDDAERRYRDIIRKHPDDAAAQYNLGVSLLTAGNFREGWKQWEWRLRAEPTILRRFPQPHWDGSDLHGRTLLVYAEQGIGDMLQFSRFVPLAGRNGRLVAVVHPPIRRLLAGLPGVSSVVALGDTLPQFDLQCPMMSLPLLLGVATEQDIPHDIPYLYADPELESRWRERVAELPGLRVGLVWAGNPERVRMDRRRSITPERLAPLAAVPGVTLVSLQKGMPTAPTAQWLRDWTSELDDFADTAALVRTLDLVIGVDTAVVHLAGALGKPVWLLNRFDTCWRWLRDRDDSPWYPTLRQFRQRVPGDWDSVMQEVKRALTEVASGPLAAQHACLCPGTS
jgi:tetratricopeptide (TPR) repeat protein